MLLGFGAITAATANRSSQDGTRNQITVQQNQHRVRCDMAAAAVSGRDTMSRCIVANESDATMPNTSDAFIEVAAFIRRQYAAEDAGAFRHDGIGLPDASSKQ